MMKPKSLSEYWDFKKGTGEDRRHFNRMFDSLVGSLDSN